jgi:hypothetical protein
MSQKKYSDEAYVIDLCDYALRRSASRQHTFGFLLGDPDKNGLCRKLPVDAYYEELELVIEYGERQHTEAVAFFDKPHRITVSGVHRGEQRRIYDERRKQLIPENGLQLIQISYIDFHYNSQKRIIRNERQDLAVVRKLLMPFIINQEGTKNLNPIFSRNADIERIAFMNWRIEPGNNIRNLKNIADGFFGSALELADACLTDNRHKRADVLIFPILTNINHGIELYLKSILWMINGITGSAERFEGTHNIQRIYETLQSKIQVYEGQLTIENFNEATRGLREYINELFEKTKATRKKDKMDFSRYPFDLNLEEHFYVLYSGTIAIDLENFVERFTIIKIQLNNLFDYLYYLDK